MKPQTRHCRNRSSTDHLSTDEGKKTNHHVKRNTFDEDDPLAAHGRISWTLIRAIGGVVFTEGSGHSQEGDLVDDGAPPHWAVMGQPGPLPHDTVDPRFLHYTAGARITYRVFKA